MIFSQDRLTDVIRQLAKTDHWLTVYSQAKEVNGLNLFHNNKDFTHIQLNLLANLSFYNSLHFDIAMNEVPAIVLDNFIYEDAYHTYRINKKNKKLKSPLIPSITPKEDTNKIVNKNQWVYTKTKGDKKK